MNEKLKKLKKHLQSFQQGKYSVSMIDDLEGEFWIKLTSKTGIITATAIEIVRSYGFLFNSVSNRDDNFQAYFYGYDEQEEIEQKFFDCIKAQTLRSESK